MLSVAATGVLGPGGECGCYYSCCSRSGRGRMTRRRGAGDSLLAVLGSVLSLGACDFSFPQAPSPPPPSEPATLHITVLGPEDVRAPGVSIAVNRLKPCVTVFCDLPVWVETRT